MSVNEAVKTIRQFCLERDCSECPYKERDMCMFSKRCVLSWDENRLANGSEVKKIDTSIAWLMDEFALSREQATTLYHLLHITIVSFKEG